MPPNTLQQVMEARLAARRAKSSLRTLTLPTLATDFSSNDFLSLSSNPAVKASFLHELGTSAEFKFGSGGSRLLDGNSVYAEDIETGLATFHNAPAGLLFNSGFDANVGFFSCVPQAGDVVMYDEFIHASVHEGMRLSRAASCVAFAHNSSEALRQGLGCLLSDNEAIRSGRCNVFVAVEALYSMDGDLAPLEDIVALLKELLPRGNGHLIVDEAHSTGIYGQRGRGVVCALGLESDIFARLHTFGKAVSCNGGQSHVILNPC